MANTPNEASTRQRILISAARLFSEKGYTETSIREIAEAVGLNTASLYYHFPSKNAILEQMLADYSEGSVNVFDEQEISDILKADPTSDGILKCLQTAFSPDKAEYFLMVLHVMLHEQLRNPFVRSYMSEHIILRTERKIKMVVEALKKHGAISQDSDPDYWMKVSSCISYTFATRMMLGIGDNAPGFSGRGMADLYRYTFDLMLEKTGASQQ